MNKPLKIAFLILGVFLLIYLSLPKPAFPDQLWDFVPSTEPADKETPMRRGYYTNLTRGQLMDHYTREFNWGVVLNYPPEEAQTIIRDQTKSTFLQEIVHPMRESLFVNGYHPPAGKGILEVNGVRYEQKAIIKYVDSNVYIRLLVGVLTLSMIWILTNEWVRTIKELKWISR